MKTTKDARLEAVDGPGSRQHVFEYDGLVFLWIKWPRGPETGPRYTGYVTASGLGFPSGTMPGDRIRNDSSDVGFYVKGRKQTRFFSFVRAMTGSDDLTVTGWKYADDTGCEIVVFNG